MEFLQVNSLYFCLYCVQASLCIVNVDRGVLDCPEEIPVLPDQGRLLIQLSEKALLHGVKVVDAAQLPHSPQLSPTMKHSGIEPLK